MIRGAELPGRWGAGGQIRAGVAADVQRAQPPQSAKKLNTCLCAGKYTGEKATQPRGGLEDSTPSWWSISPSAWVGRRGGVGAPIETKKQPKKYAHSAEEKKLCLLCEKCQSTLSSGTWGWWAPSWKHERGWDIDCQQQNSSLAAEMAAVKTTTHLYFLVSSSDLLLPAWCWCWFWCWCWGCP